eukprot:scpid100035/ scgid18989/ 
MLTARVIAARTQVGVMLPTVPSCPGTPGCSAGTERSGCVCVNALHPQWLKFVPDQTREQLAAHLLYSSTLLTVQYCKQHILGFSLLSSSSSAVPLHDRPFIID